MINERSAGAVVFRRRNNRFYYLLLEYSHKKNYYGFPRGNVEEGEDEKETAKREIKEETGLEVDFLGGFKETVSWFYRRDGNTVSKKATFFLAEAKNNVVKISEEHIGYKWLEFEKAMDVLDFENTKDILRKAHDFLFNRQKSSLKRWTNGNG